MKILFEEGNKTICTYQDLESWNRFVLSHAPSQWECLIFPDHLDVQQKDSRFLCLSGHIDSRLSWIAKISQRGNGQGTWLAGSKLFDTDSQSRDLLRTACQKLGIKDSLALDKTFCFSPRFPATSAALPLKLANETFVHTKISAKELTVEQLNQITFLAQHAWTRRGAPAVSAHFFKAALVQLMGSPKTEIFVTKVNQATRCFVLGFDGTLIAWGAINPDRDQRMLQLLLQYAHFKEDTQSKTSTPYLFERTNESLLVKAWSTFKKPKTYLMTTNGPAPQSHGVVTFQADQENLSAISWNLNGTMSGYTTIAKTDSQFVFLTDNWDLEDNHTVLTNRLHQLRRELFVRGYLAILADDGGPFTKWELNSLGFVKSPQIPVFRQSNVAPPLLK